MSTEMNVEEYRRRLLSYVEFKFVKSGGRGRPSTRVHVQEHAHERALNQGALLAYKAMSLLFFSDADELTVDEVIERSVDQAPDYLHDWGLTFLVSPEAFRFGERFFRAGLAEAVRTLQPERVTV